MATKAKAPTVKEKAPAKKPGTALTIWEREMAEAAVSHAATEVDTSSFKSISTHAGVLSIDDNALDDNEMRVIIIAFIHENLYYDKAFDPKTPMTPVCYAFGLNEAEMAPHEEVENKEAELCAGCWANEYGTADKGEGKACKNIRRLLCIAEDAIESVEELASSEPRMLKVPVTSVKNWNTYASVTLKDEVKRPCYGVITRVKLVPDAKSIFKVTFRFEELIQFDQAIYDAMLRKVKEANESIVKPYLKFYEEAKPEPKKRGKVVPIVAAKAAGKGKAPAQRAKSKF